MRNNCEVFLMENIIYLDNAATTKCLPNVRDIVEKYSNDFFYNPSSVYMGAVQVRKDLENARKELLNLLGASNHKLLFLSGATEANNLIFNSLNLRAGDKILVSVGEHPSVYNRAIKERERGIVVDFINLNSDGTVDIDDLKSKLDEKVKLVSCMYVSNETGAVNDIKKICKIVIIGFCKSTPRRRRVGVTGEKLHFPQNRHDKNKIKYRFLIIILSIIHPINHLLI